MSYKTISEFDSIKDPEERRVLYKTIESEIYRENRLFLAAQLIGAFFPGLAIIGFIDAYIRFDFVRAHPIWIGIAVITVVIAIWLWKDRYRDQRIAKRLRDRLNK